MILADKTTGSQFKPSVLAIAILLILALLLGFFLFRNTGNKNVQVTQSGDGLIYCGAEKVSGGKYVSNDYVFQNVKEQSRKHVRSGRYSCYVKEAKWEQKAMIYELSDYQVGDTYRVSVWRYRVNGGRNGGLMVLEKPNESDKDLSKEEAKELKKYYFKKKNSDIFKQEDGWEQVILYFTIPAKVNGQPINGNPLEICAFIGGKIKMYFDDLEIRKIDRQAILAKDSSLQHLSIRLEDKSIRKLEKKREVAYRAGILESSDDDWVKARLTVNGAENELKASMRLKGDWLDHLGNNKWSFRVKMKGNDVWNRLRVFSLQTPKARFFLYEYILHKYWEYEDVLTPRYDFLTVDLNGKSRGVYAYEEHFDKILAEYKSRREGPIIKMSEEGFWSSVKRQKNAFLGMDMQLGHSVHTMEASSIEPFGSGKTVKSPKLKKQFEIAQNLLYQYRTGSKSIEDIFDLERLAKFYAICDVMGAYHGLAWHNQRFYYNPVTSKLEPIGFDGFGGQKSKRNTLIGHGALNPRQLNHERLDAKLFMNKKFTERYLRELRRLSDSEYFEAFLTSIDEEIENRKILIQSEFEKYDFDRRDLIKNVRRVNMLLMPFNDLSVKVFVDKKMNGKKYLQIGNTYNLPVEIIGWGPNKSTMTNELPEPMLLESFAPRKLLGMIKESKNSEMILDTFSYKMTREAYWLQRFLSYEKLKVPESANYIYYRPFGADSIFHSSMMKWSPPHAHAPAQELFDQASLKNTEFMSVDGYQVYFRKGKYQVKEKIIIPENYHVHFEAGAELDFVNEAAFISLSPVFMRGTEEEPIMITSSDHTANGFTVLQANEKSIVGHVIFDHFNTLDYKGWTLTGAVNFYESDVDITNSVFRNNHCEDGLNIVRSEFTLISSVISNTAFDGVDCDFCKGRVEQCRFYKAGNDGLDLSGSLIEVKNCKFEDSGDKGVSVGEDTDATLYNVDISGSPIAVAAKDLSVLVIHGMNMTDCEQGFVAYQKKPEFGGSNIIVKKYKAKNIRRLHNIQKGCALQLEDQMVKGE